MTATVAGDAIAVGLQIVHGIGAESRESRKTLNLPATIHDAFNIDYSGECAVENEPLRSVVADVVLEADRTWFLNDQGQLTALWSTANPLWPAGRFVVTERQGRLDRWEFPRFGRLRLTKQNGSVRIAAPIVDRSSCGLSVWPKASWASRQNKIELEVFRTAVSRLEECAWIEPYPDGARAVVCLTDHADFDTSDKARLIADHFIRRDVCLTKTVFPAADLPSLTPWEETGLDNPQYRGSIDRLFDNGCEIAPHGFTPKRNAPSLSECKRRLELLRQYGLTTWIDHGTGDYLFSRGGRLEQGVNLEKLLEENGVRNYWSYFDVWDNPFGKDASVLSERVGLDVVSDFLDGSHGWTKTKAREAVWFALHEFRNIVGDGNDVAIRRHPWRMAAWRPAIRWYGIAKQVRRAPLGIYGRDGAVFQQSLRSSWVFDTVLLNHLALQLAPPMIDRLIQTRGLLIAHCYMACEHSYARGNVFQRHGERLAMDPAFELALDYLSDRQGAGDISTMSFVQLRRCLELFVQARLRRTENGWKAELPDGSMPYKPRTRGGSTSSFEGPAFALPRRALMEKQNVAFN